MVLSHRWWCTTHKIARVALWFGKATLQTKLLQTTARSSHPGEGEVDTRQIETQSETLERWSYPGEGDFAQSEMCPATNILDFWDFLSRKSATAFCIGVTPAKVRSTLDRARHSARNSRDGVTPAEERKRERETTGDEPFELEVPQRR